MENKQFDFENITFKITKHALDRIEERFPKLCENRQIKLLKRTIKDGYYHYSSNKKAYCVASPYSDCAVIMSLEFVIITAIKISNADEGMKKNKFIKTALDRKKRFREYLV